MDLTGYYRQMLESGAPMGGMDEAAARGVPTGPTGGYTPYTDEMRAQIAAQHAAAPQHNNAPNAPAFQPTNPNDPYYQRSDIAPIMQATNRDVLGGGAYGARAWMRDHPVGMIAAMAGLAAGGAGLAGLGGGAAGGAAAAPAAGTGGGLVQSSGLGYFANGGAAGMAGVGAGNAGVLASSGAIAGGAGAGLGASLMNYAPYAARASSLLGGQQQPAAQAPMPQGFMGSQMQMPPPQQQAPQQPSRGNPLLSYQNMPVAIPPKPFGPKIFNGQLVWT